MSNTLHPHIQSMKLINFRNYARTELVSEGQSIVLLGKNGAGKTNILEAVSLLSKGPGLRNVSADCMQNYQYTESWGIHYEIHSNKEQFAVRITKQNNRRFVHIDEKASMYTKLHKMLCVMWLVPQLDHILLKAPAERLKFFDRVVHIFDKDYSTNMIKYEKARRERRKVLYEAPHNHQWLSSLESIMAHSGIQIALTRFEVLNILQKTIAENVIDSPFLKFAIHLNSGTAEFLHYPIEQATDLYLDYLKTHRSRDAVKQCTTFGVHNDKFQILNTEKNLVANSCSTGEQKILLLSLLLAAAISKQKLHGQAPIMLLDDIMSHLDNKHKGELIAALESTKCQAWITDVDPQNFNKCRKNFRCFCISDNLISPAP